jgi:hypothetical protein
MILTITLHNNDTTPRHNGVGSIWCECFNHFTKKNDDKQIAYSSLHLQGMNQMM